MLSTDFSTLLLIAAATMAVFFSAYALYLAAKARQFANDCAIWVQKANSESVSLAKLAELQAQMTELGDSYAALMKAFKRLNARNASRIAREQQQDGVDLATTDDKQALRDQLRKDGRLRS